MVWWIEVIGTSWALIVCLALAYFRVFDEGQP